MARSGVSYRGESVENYVQAVTVDQKASIMYFTGGRKFPFFRITMALPKHVATARSKRDPKKVDENSNLT
jgi:hypothetical protein